VAKRSRKRPSAAAAPPTPAAPAATPGARRTTITLSLVFGIGALAALLLASARGTTLLCLLVLLGAALGGMRAGRAIGLPRGLAAALAAGAGFALLLAVGALLPTGLQEGLAVPGLVVAALAALLVVDVVGVTPGPAPPRAARLGVALGRGRTLAVVATVALAALAARACWVALGTEHDAAFGVALLALVAVGLLWRASGPRALLLATLLCGLIPAVVALGVGTACGLWPPITRTLAVILGGAPARPLLLALCSLAAAALAAALAVRLLQPGDDAGA
jgi:hypothetical protein